MDAIRVFMFTQALTIILSIKLLNKCYFNLLQIHIDLFIENNLINEHYW